ncbi:Os10g0264950 [Oryza sativa Japonica Group]|uniref:Os10g0264950 protein n=1 Tax=Oryza sativa subsp. japonica TaxID=39947 RepID=A0A0P0XT43_ORYSJ|nr:Os10g0264950 [Oryza sativa Japonica Group]
MEAAEVSLPVARPRGGGGGSRIKNALGLKARRLSSSAVAATQPMMVRTLSQTLGPALPGRGRQLMTSAEIMRQQIRVTEQNNARLRRTLMRAIVGQLKPVEFPDGEEYHQWQFRQVKLLEAGLILHPSLPLDRLNSAVLRFREVMRATEIRAIDTAKNSNAMRTLTSAVHALAWRSGVGSGGGDACHWADGYSLNRPLTLRAHDRRSSLLPLALRPLLSSEFVALDLLLPDALPTGSGKSQVLKEGVGSQRRRQHQERGKEEEDDAGGGDIALQVIRSGLKLLKRRETDGEDGDRLLRKQMRGGDYGMARPLSIACTPSSRDCTRLSPRMHEPGLAEELRSIPAFPLSLVQWSFLHQLSLARMRRDNEGSGGRWKLGGGRGAAADGT